MSDSEEDAYAGPGVMDSYEGGDAGYEGFFAWKDRYVNGGKQKWGRGNCFDFCSRGI